MFLELKNVKKSYGSGENKVQVLKGINLSIKKGDFVVLLGPSGSGKSTLLNIIGGIDEMDEGSLVIDGRELKDTKEKALTEYRRKHLGFVFQRYNLIPDLTVRENIETGAYLAENPLDLESLIKELGLKEQEEKIPYKLSGGQQQRTAIGRAIIKNPSILLCDEPTGALDSETSKEILRLISKINEEYKSTVIMVTHNIAIKEMADRVLEIKDGVIKKDYQNEKKLSADEIEW